MFLYIHYLTTICKLWNDCVFNSVTPCVSVVVWLVEEEELLWCAAGAHHLASLEAFLFLLMVMLLVSCIVCNLSELCCLCVCVCVLCALVRVCSYAAVSFFLSSMKMKALLHVRGTTDH